ncbi:MAG: hypothetical protein MUC50_12585 [Myxococcota bacterium]|jgi:hypothetical protein|nr:hypothetical protein [Myxococcota bacterium]
MKLARSTLLALCVFMLGLGLGCGSKKPKSTDTGDKPATTQAEEQERVEQAKVKLQDFLGEKLAAHIKTLGGQIAKQASSKISGSAKVNEAAGKLTKDLFEDPTIKPTIEKIADDATGGLAKKLSLGWKALTHGGVDQYKAKVKEKARNAAVSVLTEYAKTHILAGEKGGELLKGFGPALRLTGAASVAGLQENLSPRVTKKILGIATRIAAQSDKAQIAERIEAWLAECESLTAKESEKLLSGMSQLPAFEKAVVGLAVEVLGHPTTKKELVIAFRAMLADDKVRQAITKVYEDASFNQSEDRIKADIEATLAIALVQEELYGALARLTGAPGAGGIMSRHVGLIAEDPRFAAMVEEFTLNVLEGCGDPVLK